MSDIFHNSPLGKSDHDILLFNLYVNKNIDKEVDDTTYNLMKGNNNEMRKELDQMNWQGLNELDVEQCWYVIKDTIHKVMDKHIPKIKSETNSKGKKPKWITWKMQKIINKKNNLYRKYIISKKQYDLSLYIKCWNESDAEVRKAKSQFEKQIAKDCKSNPKFFWKYVQQKIKQTTGINPFDRGDGVFVDDDKDKADILNAGNHTKRSKKKLQTILESRTTRPPGCTVRSQSSSRSQSFTGEQHQTPRSESKISQAQDSRMPKRLERKNSLPKLWERWPEALETNKAAQWWRKLQSKDHPGREQQVTDWETSCWQVCWKLCKWEQDSHQRFKAERSKERGQGKNSQQNSCETHASAPQTWWTTKSSEETETK